MHLEMCGKRVPRSPTDLLISFSAFCGPDLPAVRRLLYRHRIDLGLLKSPIEPVLTRLVDDYIFVQKDKGLKMAKKNPLFTLSEPVNQGLWNQDSIVRHPERRAEENDQEVPL